MKKELLKTIATVAEKVAKFGAGSVSGGLSYQPVTPKALQEKDSGK
ncbi:cyclic lactone autoinducer peptide [Ethanoligenens sp.]